MYVHSFPKMVLDDNGLILLPEISLSWAKKRTACTLGKRLYSLHSKISPDWCNSAIIILKSLINLFFFVSLDHCKEMWEDFKINLIFLLLYCKRIIFSVYDIWRNFNFWLFSVDLNWRFILINLIIPKKMHI